MSPKNHIISSVPSNEVQSPRTFISYSWSSPEHEARVLQLATELEESGVDVILDKWDLREGADKYAYPGINAYHGASSERAKEEPDNLISWRIYYAPSALTNLLSYATLGRCPRLLHCAPLALCAHEL